MIYHYCRVSSADQNLDRQLDELSKHAAADRVFTDKASGKDFDRAGYNALKAVVAAGDEIYIKELDRLGRNKDEIKAELQWFREHDVSVRILDIPTTLIDFKGQGWVQDMINNILIEVLGAVAEQERLKIKRRQAEGIAAKKAHGNWDDYGRPNKVIDENLFSELLQKNKKGDATVAECCKALGISRSLWYNKLSAMKEGTA